MLVRVSGFYLPTVGHYGYASTFFFWATCTVLYFLVAAFLLPETKGRTVEQVEADFRGSGKG